MVFVDNPKQRGHSIDKTGEMVAQNIARVRKSSNVSLQELERRLDGLGRRISFSGLSKIERHLKRVEVDDLMAIAIALDVSPLALLLPQGDPYEPVEVTGAVGSTALFWEWAMGERPMNWQDHRGYEARSLPAWLGSNPDVEWWGDQEIVLGVGEELPRVIGDVRYAARTRDEVAWPRR